MIEREKCHYRHFFSSLLSLFCPVTFVAWAPKFYGNIKITPKTKIQGTPDFFIVSMHNAHGCNILNKYLKNKTGQKLSLSGPVVHSASYNTFIVAYKYGH